MKRVFVIGPPGSGKSTFSRELSAVKRLPVISLDREFWGPGWVPTPSSEWHKKIHEITSGDYWIVEGSDPTVLPIVKSRVDVIFWLDLPSHICVFRVLKRLLPFSRKSRLGMPDGCKERFYFPFLKYVLSYKKVNSEFISTFSGSESIPSSFIVFNSTEEINFYISRIEKSALAQR
jgi:adenylate kinase family enzyme